MYTIDITEKNLSRATIVSLLILAQGRSEKLIWHLKKIRRSKRSSYYLLPFEAYEWFNSTDNRLSHEYAKLIFRAYNIAAEAERITDRKHMAEFVLKKHKDIAGLVFAIIDKKKKAWDVAWHYLRNKSGNRFEPEIKVIQTENGNTNMLQLRNGYHMSVRPYEESTRLHA